MQKYNQPRRKRDEKRYRTRRTPYGSQHSYQHKNNQYIFHGIYSCRDIWAISAAV